MNTNMYRVLFFMMVTAWPLFWFKADFILGADEWSHLYSLNYLNMIVDYTWNPVFNGGYHTLDIQNYFPTVLIRRILDHFVEINLSIRIFFMLLILLTSYTMFYFLHNCLQLKSFSSYVGVVFYLLNSYTVLSFQAINIRLILIVIPLIFIIMYKHMQHRNTIKTAIYLNFAFLVITQVSANISAFSVPFILLFISALYFLYLGDLKTREFTKILYLFIFIYILLNIWWLLILIPNMLSSSDALAAVSSSAAKLRNQEYLGIHNVLRGIGYWAFFSDLKIGDKTTSFIPIANLYKYNITVILTFLAPTLAVVGLLAFTRKTSMMLLFLLSLVIFIFLAKGTHFPFGSIYQWVFDNIKIFWVYRDPWAKFTPVIIFSIAVLSAYGYEKIYLYTNHVKKFEFVTFILIISLLIYVSNYLFFDYNYGAMRTMHVSIPKYWNDFNEDNKLIQNKKSRDIVLPPSSNGSYFWKDGYSGPTTVVPLFNNKDLVVAKGFVSRGSNSEYLIKILYDNLLGSEKINNLSKMRSYRENKYIISNENKIITKKIIALFGVDRLIVQNDYNWLSGGKRVFPPSINEKIIAQHETFNNKRTFGLLKEEYVKSIDMGEDLKKDSLLSKYVRSEMIGRAGIDTYSVREENLQDRVYLGDKIHTYFDMSEISKILLSEEHSINDIIIENKNYLLINKLFNTDNFRTKQTKLKLTKINPTKYNLSISNAPNVIFVVFSEAFDPNWDIPLPLPEENKYHLSVNGYANGWLLNTKQVCSREIILCDKNIDGSYNLKLTIEYQKQMIFEYLKIFSILFFFTLVLYLLMIYHRKKLSVANN